MNVDAFITIFVGAGQLRRFNSLYSVKSKASFIV